MEEFPPEVERSLMKGLGAYLRATPTSELPTRVRRFSSFTDTAMARHKKEILGLLEDEASRALIQEWLTDGKPRLPKDAARRLLIAAEQSDGWGDRLREAQGVPKAAPLKADPLARTKEELENQRAKTKKARDELQRLRVESASSLKKETARSAKLAGEVAELKTRVTELEADARRTQREAGASAAKTERELRRSRRDADAARADRDKAQQALKDLRSELRAAKSRIAALERKDAPKKKTARKPSPKQPAGPRKPLPVPKGRYEDAPETLAEWLQPGVTLVIDGYNVTKAERGFGELKLEAQRDRLIKEVEQLARKKKVTGTIVFDGSEVPPGTSRSRRGPVRVEFSAPDEIADDHIVALIEGLPPDPLVLVTNDRELQQRARALEATIATSDQFLALIR